MDACAESEAGDYGRINLNEMKRVAAAAPLPKQGLASASGTKCRLNRARAICGAAAPLT